MEDYIHTGSILASSSAPAPLATHSSMDMANQRLLSYSKWVSFAISSVNLSAAPAGTFAESTPKSIGSPPLTAGASG